MWAETNSEKGKSDRTMTREEAIDILRSYLMFDKSNMQIDMALNMAIEALQAEPTKAVPPSLADVYKWERDIALSQLEEYGIGFAEKKRDDLVEVVRCKNCRYRKKVGTSYYCELDEFNVKDEDFCSWGERREE